MKGLFLPLDKFLQYDYWRVTDFYTCRPALVPARRRPRWQDEAITGGFYVIGKIWPKTYDVKIFWLKSYDRDLDPTGPYALSPEHKNDPAYRRVGPCEALTPGEILEVFFPELVAEARAV